MADDRWFEELAGITRTAVRERAPAHLKSKIYSSLVTEMARSGPLLDLKAVEDAGGQLCVFENALAILPGAAGVRSMNPCRICHARLLGERMEHAPIFWPGCPYSEFHRRGGH